MTLGIAAFLLLLTVAGICAACVGLRAKPVLRRILIVLLILLALALLGYIGLTLLFVDAVSHQPPG